MRLEQLERAQKRQLEQAVTTDEVIVVGDYKAALEALATQAEVHCAETFEAAAEAGDLMGLLENTFEALAYSAEEKAANEYLQNSATLYNESPAPQQNASLFGKGKPTQNWRGTERNDVRSPTPAPENETPSTQFTR